MELELELGDDAEAAAPAAERPEEVGMPVPVRPLDPSIREHHLGADQALAARAERPLEPAASTAERDAGDTET